MVCDTKVIVKENNDHDSHYFDHLTSPDGQQLGLWVKSQGKVDIGIGIGIDISIGICIILYRYQNCQLVVDEGSNFVIGVN